MVHNRNITLVNNNKIAKDVSTNLWYFGGAEFKNESGFFELALVFEIMDTYHKLIAAICIKRVLQVTVDSMSCN